MSVGAASGDWAIVSVNPSNHLSRFAAQRTRRTRYLMAAGVYPDFYWPNNITDWPVEVLPADRNNPPTIRALAFGKRPSTGRNFSHLQNAPAGSNFQNVKVDGLNFIAERFRQAGNVSLVLPDGEGLGWRIQGTSHPSAGMVGGKESGSYIGLDINAGSGFEITNCLFDGYAVQVGSVGAVAAPTFTTTNSGILPKTGSSSETGFASSGTSGISCADRRRPCRSFRAARTRHIRMRYSR